MNQQDFKNHPDFKNQPDFKGMRLGNAPITVFFVSLIILHLSGNFILALIGSLIIYILMHIYTVIIYKKIINKIGFIINKWNIGVSLTIHSINHNEYKKYVCNYFNQYLTSYEKEMLSCENCGELPNYLPSLQPSKFCEFCGNKLDSVIIYNTLLNINTNNIYSFVETFNLGHKAPFTFHILNFMGKLLIPAEIYIFFYLWYLHPEDLLLLNSSPFWGSVISLIIIAVSDILIITTLWLLSTNRKTGIQI